MGVGRGRLLPELARLQAEVEPTPAQRCLERWIAASQRSEVFRQLVVTGLRVEQRVLNVLELSGPIGEDHGALLRLMALSLAAGLLDEDALAECHAVCPERDWLDGVVRRIAWSVAVGGGKTLTTASLCRAVADQLVSDPECKGPLSRGVLYSCRTHKLIEGMLQALELMGVPRELVGVFHGTRGAAVPSIKREALNSYPIVLTTQAQLRNGSANHDAGTSCASEEEDGLDLEELLLYRGKDRLTIWDEAFQSSLADSASAEWLGLALGSLKQKLVNASDEKPVKLAPKNARTPLVPDWISKRDGEALVWLLDRIVGGVQSAVERADGPVSPIHVPAVSERQTYQLLGVRNWLRMAKSWGPAAAVEAVSGIAAAGALDVAVLEGRESGSTIVRPRVVISDRLRRLAILDAGYTTGLIAQMDPTVQLASGAGYAGRELEAKLFNNVTVHCYPDPSGRGNSISESGLSDGRVRRRLIREQVDRISRVPAGEHSLVVTYDRAEGIDFVNEIEEELNQACRGWRDLINGQQRVTIIHWGEHVGANDWRNAKHLFFIGVLRRRWAGDLSGEAYATSRQDKQAWASVSASAVEVNQAAQEIMQAVGRGHARATINGQAGQMTIHLPWKEGSGKYAGSGVVEGSPLWMELKQMMPGCVIIPSGQAPKASGADRVEEAVHQALGTVMSERITTKELKALVLELLGEPVTDRVIGLGFKQAAESNAKKLARGIETWVKPDSRARSWVRAGTSTIESTTTKAE